MAKINKSGIDALRKSVTQSEVYLWDDELKGFGVRMYPSGACRFILKYRTPGGAQRKHSLGKTGVITAEQARDLAKIALGKLASGQDPAEEDTRQKSRRLQIRQLCELYLEAAKEGLVTGRRGTPKKATTIYTDRGRIERHIIPLLGAKLVRDVSRPDIERFKSEVATGRTAVDLRTGVRGRARVTGGKGTATRTLGLLGGIFTWAISNRHGETNPVQGVRRFASRERKALLSTLQYRVLGETMREMSAARHRKGKPIHNQAGLDCIAFLALTGMRKGEAQNLTWSEVSFEHRCLRLDDTKTGGSVRPIGDQALSLLEARKLSSQGPYVFASPFSPLEPFRGLPGLWATLKKKAANAEEPSSRLENLTLHSLRHSFAGVADEAGLTLPTIAALLGQRLGGVTSGYILKRLDGPLLSAANRVCAAVAAYMIGNEET